MSFLWNLAKILIYYLRIWKVKKKLVFSSVSYQNAVLWSQSVIKQNLQEYYNFMRLYYIKHNMWNTYIRKCIFFIWHILLSQLYNSGSQ